jgi:hypothetical protein
MNVYEILSTVLYGVVVVTFITNILQLLKESKQLKEAGKTPLMGRNLTVITLAALGEVVVIFLIMLLFASLSLPVNVGLVFAIFILAYLLRNVGAYLVAWGLWSLFVKIDQRKLKKELEQEREGAL